MRKIPLPLQFDLYFEQNSFSFLLAIHPACAWTKNKQKNTGATINQWDYFHSAYVYVSICLPVVSSASSVPSARRGENNSWLSALYRIRARQAIEDMPWAKSVVVLGLIPRQKAGAVELIVCAAFHLPPVLCYQRTLDCLERDPAGCGEEGGWHGEQTHGNTHTHSDTWKYCTQIISALWHYTFQQSSVVCFTHNKIHLIDRCVWSRLL